MIVPPWYSSGLSFLLRARAARSFTASLISRSAFLLRIADDRRDEPFLDRDGDGEIDAAVLDDRVAREARIHRRHFHRGGDDGLQDEVIDRQLRPTPAASLAAFASARNFISGAASTSMFR